MRALMLAFIVFRLSERQVRGALEYIAAHDEDVEREYREVLDDAEEQRRYWEERNRERLARIAAAPPPPEQRELRAHITALKARLAREARDDSREATEGERTAAQ